MEDAVQAALLSAVSGWQRSLPADPAAWLYRVAHNRVIDAFRRSHAKAPIDDADELEATASASPRLSAELDDDLLRMLFVCCHEDLPTTGCLVSALKLLCGFSTAEIALRLFLTEQNVHKHLERAKERLRAADFDWDEGSKAVLARRLPAVRTVLYLLFNEGYHSSHGDRLVRRELCDEAIRLTSMLARHPVGADSETFALLALMLLHASRLETRTDGSGGLLLLEEQDRTQWDTALIAQGFSWLERSAEGEVFTKFHAEAFIAAEHCRAPSFAETRWGEIVDLYLMLEKIEPSPLHTLNRSVAVAQLQGPGAGIELLEALVPPAWLTGFYLWDSVLGELHRRAGHVDLARRHLERALELAPAEAERALLRRRLSAV